MLRTLPMLDTAVRIII